MKNKIEVAVEDICRVIDHTYLKTLKEGHSLLKQEEAIEQLAQEAHAGEAYSICVREHMVEYATRVLKELNSTVKVCSVVGFPFGDDYPTAEKIQLLNYARDKGAEEFDAVFNYRHFLAGQKDAALKDIIALCREAGNATLKIILELGAYEESDWQEAADLVAKAFQITQPKYPQAGRFLKTSTGFYLLEGGETSGATLSQVKKLHQASKGKWGIKPAGGVADYDAAMKFFIAAGSPLLVGGGGIDPQKFRIGSSSLLGKLKSEIKSSKAEGEPIS